MSDRRPQNRDGNLGWILPATLIATLAVSGCMIDVSRIRDEASEEPAALSVESAAIPDPNFVLGDENTHNKFSATIPPRLTVPSGSVISVTTKEATDGQLTVDSISEDLLTLDLEPIHPLTGPIYVESALPGDVLAVKIHQIDILGWGWTGIFPDFGFLIDDFPEPWLKTFHIGPDDSHVELADGVSIALNPFPGVIGVAPATEDLLSTIPPRANGGNMDNRYLNVGTTIYLPVFVDGALLSLGDTHAAQGDGEVCGTGIEAPMRLLIEVEVLKGGRSIPEPEYETDDYYAVTAFAETIDEAAAKATRYMIDYLVAEKSLTREEAYALISLAGDLKISEVVDVPHVLVSLHLPHSVFM